jgi:hypothetical protein
MKPVEIVLSKREGRRRENDGGGKSKIYCKQICKYGNVSFVQLLCNYCKVMLIKKK